jgi:hypothetical protein
MNRDLSRRLFLLAPLALLSSNANARGGRGGRGRGSRNGEGGVGVAIFGLGAVFFVMMAAFGRFSRWRYRRARAIAGFPIPPQSEWEKQGRCPICGEIMQKVDRPIVRSRRRQVKQAQRTTVLYRCSSLLKCSGVRIIPFKAEVPGA